MEERFYKEKGLIQVLSIIQRVCMLLAIVMMFFPGLNPTRICEKIGKNVSLFTSAVSYSKLTSELGRAFSVGWVDESVFILAYVCSIVAVLGLILMGVSGCMSVGNLKLKNIGQLFGIGGGVLLAGSMFGINSAYNTLTTFEHASRVRPVSPSATIFYIVMGIIVAVLAIVLTIMLPKAERGSRIEMESKYKLFLMFLPFVVLCFVFSYLPLYGWRYAFFDYKAGQNLSADNFAGLKWFTYLFRNAATRADIVRVLRNTLAMSFLGIATQWLPMAFAIFLCEIKNMRLRRFIQTFTTIPNFISWVLVYALALAIFSTDGFINTIGQQLNLVKEPQNYLMGSDWIWVKMWLWGTWKGIGWSAIIYISGIAGIDQQLYEAATVDGAGRFQKMWHITVPGLLPTFFVLLLMAVAGVLSNGMDQYLVFENATNSKPIEVLDLYVYHLGIGNGSIPLSTVIGMAKSIVSVALLFAANTASKVLRGESIV